MRFNFFFTAPAVFIPLALAGCINVGINAGPARVLNLGLNPDSKTGAIMVNAGDNLWSISKRYRLPIRDIISLNSIHPPYSISEGQRLKLPAPVTYHVRRGDTLYSIARMFNVSVYKLVQTNRIKHPYVISVDQRLRIPSSFTQSAGRTVRKQESYSPTKKSSSHIVQKPKTSSRKSVATIQDSRRPDFIWPIRGKIISSYGGKQDGLYNDGINIAAPKRTPVLATADGVIAYVGDDLKSYGNLILIRHDSGGMTTAYAHLDSINVKKGQRIKKSDVIGTVGSTGSVSSSQLHFEIRKGSKTYDPVKYL